MSKEVSMYYSYFHCQLVIFLLIIFPQLTGYFRLDIGSRSYFEEQDSPSSLALDILTPHPSPPFTANPKDISIAEEPDKTNMVCVCVCHMSGWGGYVVIMEYCRGA